MIEKHIHRNYKYKDVWVSRFVSFLDSDGVPLLLPSLFSFSINKKGSVLNSKRVEASEGEIEHVFYNQELGEVGVNVYEDQLLHFLNYYEQFQKTTPGIPSVHKHSHAPTEFINTYLNDELIEKQEKSPEVVGKAKSALTAYYNYLADVGISKVKEFLIYPSNLAKARKNRKRKRAYKYVAKITRSQLVLECKTLRNELILQFGFECGLRSHENTSLFLNDFSYGKKKQKGFLTLFDDLEDENKQEFEYLLTITKARKNVGSPSRFIYIPRQLVEKCHRYYLLERGDSTVNELFVNNDSVTRGKACPGSIGTTVFRVAKNSLLEKMASGEVDEVPLHEDNGYHHLRHSFATERFYKLCGNTPHHAITEGHTVVTEISRLMGHKINNKGGAQKITMDYIRTIDIMLTIEGQM